MAHNMDQKRQIYLSKEKNIEKTNLPVVGKQIISRKVNHG